MSLRDAWHARSDQLGRELRTSEVVRPDQVTRDVAVREHRDPTAATTMTKYQSPGTVQIPEWDAESAIRNAYLIDVVVARCVQIRAQTIAAVPFRAGADPNKPGDFNPTAPLAKLLGPAPYGPAPGLSSQVWWEWVVAQRILTGRWGSEIELTSSGEVVALWPLASSYLRAVPTSSGAAWWSGFTYGRDREPKKLRTDQVLYGWDPSPLDFREPYSVLQSGRLAISVAVMCARYNYGFLRNDARPAAVVVMEQFADEEEFRRFKLGWQGEYGGPDNAGKMRFLETDPDKAVKPSEALNVFQLGLSQRDARMIEQEKAALEHVAIALGVPWSKLDASGRTFDNASQEDLSFWEATVLPDLTKFADEINNGLAPRLGKDVGWFDLSNVRALRPQSRFERLVDGLSAHDRALITTNEIRNEMRLPPLPGGDELTPRQLAALEPAPVTFGAQGTPLTVAATAVQGEERILELDVLDDSDLEHPALPPLRALESLDLETRSARRIDVRLPDGETFIEACRRIADRLPNNHPVQEGLQDALEAASDERQQQDLETRSTAPVTLEHRETDTEARERRARIWHTTDATVRTLEARWAKAMRRLFARQQKAVLSRLEGNRGRRVTGHRSSADDVFDPDFWTTETVDDTEALYELVATSGFARVSAQFGINFDLEAAYARDFIEARANQLAGQVTDTTYQAITDQLAEGVAAGESIPDLATRIRGVFDDASKTRAVTIARTETISAFNGSASLAAAQLPDDVVGGQEWIATVDGRTRDDHADADGQVVGMDEAFNVGGESLAYPGDPSGDPGNTVNCRCAIGFLTPDEMPSRATHVEHRIALTALALITDNAPFDELALRRALREAAA